MNNRDDSSSVKKVKEQIETGQKLFLFEDAMLKKLHKKHRKHFTVTAGVIKYDNGKSPTIGIHISSEKHKVDSTISIKLDGLNVSSKQELDTGVIKDGLAERVAKTVGILEKKNLQEKKVTVTKNDVSKMRNDLADAKGDQAFSKGAIACGLAIVGLLIPVAGSAMATAYLPIGVASIVGGVTSLLYGKGKESKIKESLKNNPEYTFGALEELHGPGLGSDADPDPGSHYRP